MAELIGVSKNSWERYERGAVRPGTDVLASIGRQGIDLHWLVTGESVRDSSTESGQVQVVRTQPEQGGAVMMQVTNPEGLVQGAFVMVPKMEARASAGTGIIPTSDAVDALVAFEEAYLRSLGVSPRFARLLEIAGDSMLPTLADRDQVVVDTSIDDVRADALYAVVFGGAVMVKRLQIQGDGSVLLKSDNRSAGYDDHRIPASDLHDLHVVGRVCGQFRRI